MICRHCHEAVVSRPRGLCWSCYYTPGLRERYPTDSKFARRGLGIFKGPARIPRLATSAAPGSPEKIKVLMERARLRQELWHPDDATLAEPRRCPALAG